MQYLKATKTLDIMYNKEEGSNLIIKSYFNSNWASDNITKKSTSDFIFMLNRGPVSGCSKKPVMVALLLTEAEYVVLTLVAKEAT